MGHGNGVIGNCTAMHLNKKLFENSMIATGKHYNKSIKLLMLDMWLCCV